MERRKARTYIIADNAGRIRIPPPPPRAKSYLSINTRVPRVVIRHEYAWWRERRGGRLMLSHYGDERKAK